MKQTGFFTLVVTAITFIPSDAHALPAWARKYNMNCSGCHAPAAPRLNAKGFAFKWAGYRMPEEIGENQEVKQIQDYFAARARVQYLVAKTATQATETNSFNLNDETLFAAGAIGKNFGAMLEFSNSAEGVDLMTTLVGVWGKEKQFYGVLGGKMHWIYEGGVAGFDRPTGIDGPTPLLSPTTSANPFQIAPDQLGVEAFYVAGRNHLAVQVLNSTSARGPMLQAGAPTTKDFAVIEQFIYDSRGSGFTAMGYYGSIAGLDTTATAIRTSHFTRMAITANKIFKHVEVLGGYVYSNDTDLPVGSVFNRSSMTGLGYWVYGGYTFPSALTIFSRYEIVNPNTDATKEGNNRLAFGGVLPISLPEYLRLAAEYTLDTPRADGGLKKHRFSLEMMFAF